MRNRFAEFDDKSAEETRSILQHWSIEDQKKRAIKIGHHRQNLSRVSEGVVWEPAATHPRVCFEQEGRGVVEGACALSSAAVGLSSAASG